MLQTKPSQEVLPLEVPSWKDLKAIKDPLLRMMKFFAYSKEKNPEENSVNQSIIKVENFEEQKCFSGILTLDFFHSRVPLADCDQERVKERHPACSVAGREGSHLCFFLVAGQCPASQRPLNT